MAGGWLVSIFEITWRLLRKCQLSRPLGTDLHDQQVLDSLVSTVVHSRSKHPGLTLNPFTRHQSVYSNWLLILEWRKKSTSYIASLNYQLHDINEQPNQQSVNITVVSAQNGTLIESLGRRTRTYWTSGASFLYSKRPSHWHWHWSVSDTNWHSQTLKKLTSLGL